MGKFTIRLDDVEEKILSRTMKEERFKTKNSGIQYVLREHSKLKKALQDKIRELNTLSTEYDRIYYLTESKMNIDKQLNQLFDKKKKKRSIKRDVDEEE